MCACNNHGSASSIPGKKKDLNNGIHLKKEKEFPLMDQSFTDFELEIDDEIISYLSAHICNKNVRHKILKINNLIDERMRYYIEKGETKDAGEENKTNDVSESFQENFSSREKPSNNPTNCDMQRENTVSLFSGEPNSAESGHSGKSGEHVNGDKNASRAKFSKIKGIDLLGENAIVYNSKEEENNVLFLCYDEENEECDICNRYKRNYMTNIQPASGATRKCTNGVNDGANSGAGAHNGFNPFKEFGASEKLFVSAKSGTEIELSNYFFVLGSTSNSRKYILKKSNLDFLSVSIHIDEKKIGCRKQHDPFTLTANISVAKGLKLLSMIKQNNELREEILSCSKNKRVVLLVGDEVIYCNDKIYEKPKNEKEAYDFLKSYNNNRCYSYSSVTLIELETEKMITGIDESIISVYGMDDTVLRNILNDSTIYYCAGALKIENTFMHKYIKVIKGNVDSIFGLSINLLFHLVNFL
ncbi:Maf-like protein, putative [Plasmodium ovale]|uniref:Maf-like protein, putative n=2 Tax=Plasmodium ovale TaxID=36330 RepID=A0A1A8VZG5_PLAOA|nr:Maf-like protein, putative [Plasmodium ovale curtisi]SCQ16052.1 Maf-like protein, putative [Plasmodium ovale]